MRLSHTRHCSGLMRFAHRTPWGPQRQRIGYSDTHCGSCTASAVRSESRTVCGRACLCLDDPEPSPWRLHTASGSALHSCMWCLCDSGPLFGVMALAAPVSLLPSVIPPSPEVPSLHRHYAASPVHRTSLPPDPTLRPVPCAHNPDRASLVAAVPLFDACRRHYPDGTVVPPVAHFPTRPSLPRVIGGSASTSFFFEACLAFNLVTACLFAESPSNPLQPKCFSQGRYLPKPHRLLPAGTTIAGWFSCPRGDSTIPRRTISSFAIQISG